MISMLIRPRRIGVVCRVIVGRPGLPVRSDCLREDSAGTTAKKAKLSR